MESKTQDRYRQAECDVYGKPMRSNILKRYKKTHKDLSMEIATYRFQRNRKLESGEEIDDVYARCFRNQQL